MKKFVLIASGLVILAVGAIASIFFYRETEKEKEKNSKQTAAARAVRWLKRPEEDETEFEQPKPIAGTPGDTLPPGPTYTKNEVTV